MKNENLDDKGQFKMRLDEEEAEASPIASQVDDLRIEKLSHRMTLITILIPVLIVIVLVIAYMDIKKRVIQTEDTGQLTAESLSKELESRFESLTRAQKAVEENLAGLKDQSDKSIAKVQINLKKLDDKLVGITKRMASQKELKAASNRLSQNVTNVAQSMEELKLQLEQINSTVKPQIVSLENTLSEYKSRMDLLDDKLAALDSQKIDKAKLDLALKLETLKINQNLKAQLDELQSRLTTVEKSASKQAKTPAPAVKAPAATPATAPPDAPSPALPPSSSGELEEQNIGK
jgi:DNA repair exonuclease SbcCD ATPase subunit